jgi:BirA family biotin operon repressor/biotin-[acetyl-CoA-carboxylase] ligase
MIHPSKSITSIFGRFLSRHFVDRQPKIQYQLTIMRKRCYERGMSTKEALLKHLKESAGVWVSGERLATALSISRTAIWKHIKTLQEEGYGITSSTGRGYLLQEMPDRLLPAEIMDGLQTRVFGRRGINYYSETDSTNIRARALAHKGAPEGTIVVAETQTQGRGRRGRTWFSPPGSGIYMSIVLRPRVQPHEAPLLTLVAAVSMTETLFEMVDLPFKIKWPNDILIEGKKISGILTEMSLEMERVDYVIVGVGLNVNTEPDAMEDEIREIASSLRILTGKVFSRIQILQVFLKRLEHYYDLFQDRQFETIRNRWKELSGVIGRQVKIINPDGVCEGEAVDIDSDGFLVLRSPTGDFQRIVAGDVLYQ